MLIVSQSTAAIGPDAKNADRDVRLTYFVHISWPRSANVAKFYAIVNREKIKKRICHFVLRLPFFL